MSEITRPRPRYTVELTAEQWRRITSTCDWGSCDEPTIGLRRDSDTGKWLSVCEDHVRMGNTVVLGADAVVEALVLRGVRT